MATHGIGDPYWYEWFVGLKYVIEMLDPDSGISSVIFQSDHYTTIDDVVVEYANGSIEWCYQVKHEIATSRSNNLTFGKMMEKKDDKNCLFKALFLGWKEASIDGKNTKKTVLYTNRKMLNRRAGRNFRRNKYSAYSLEKFIELMNHKFVECQDSIDFLEEEKDLELQWNEFLEALGTIEISKVSLFLSEFVVEANQPELTDMKQLLVNNLAEKFSCNEGIAQELFSKLLLGLSEWTIVTRKSEKVILEDVHSVLGLEEDINDSQHRLAPPYPFFYSRQKFCEDLEAIIRDTDKNVVFISGDPGSGKTSTISYLQSRTNIFMFRYHTFRPISPEQHFYNDDSGMYTAENLWGTLLIQLRKRLKGKLAKYKVPVSNKLVNKNDLRMHVLRLLSMLGEEAIKHKARVFLCVDGIDHAARANNQVSFLTSLPLPSEIPSGVCFVIVGQPIQMYKEQYPLWLSTSKEIERIEMTKLEVADIKQLILEKASQFEDGVDGLAHLINAKTEGNNLSTVFAIEEIRKLDSIENSINYIKSSGINADIQQYYSHIWAHMKNELGRIAPVMMFPESIVACPLLLMNGRVNVRILARALPYELSINDWMMLFKHLYPLIVPTENEEEYALFHNDFRIFLMDIISSYNERYKEIAMHLADDLLKNEEGLLSYIAPIPLLMCASKENIIPQYFNTGYVINSLAEGVSKIRLDEYAHISYDIACTNRDIDEYVNTYLAIKTLYQHERYFEYYQREYSSNDYPEIVSIDISEIRTLPLTQDNLNEFKRVLEFCIKLYSTKHIECRVRALRLYDLWFKNLTLLSIILLCEESITKENARKLQSSSEGRFLEQWGSTIAQLEVSLPRIDEGMSRLEKVAAMILGDKYFEYCIDNAMYDFAAEALCRGYVTKSCFGEHLINIYYENASSQFESILTQLSEKEDKPLWKVLILVMLATQNEYFSINSEFFDSLQPIKHTYDEANFTIILRAFLLGCHRRKKEDSILIEEVESCYKHLEGTDDERAQITFLARFSCLLGKNYFYTRSSSKIFEGYVEWFLNARLYRSHEYSSGRKFLIFTLLNSVPSIVYSKEKWFVNSLQTSLFEIGNLGMYYKTYILDYLKRHGCLDIIKKYINELYGKNCRKINLIEDKNDLHRQFLSFGELVEPELMKMCTSLLKWDVVGYMGNKEFAMYGPCDCFETILEAQPDKWKDLSERLYRQSQIADQSNNRASFDICKNIVKVATSKGLSDYWELHTLNDEFRINPDLIYEAMFGFIECSNDSSELENIWLLSCGIHSWYTQDGHSGAKAIYDSCCKRAEGISFDFCSFVKKITPSWARILQQYPREKKYASSNDNYTVARNAEIATIIELYKKLSLQELLLELPSVALFSHTTERVTIILERVLLEDTNQYENLQEILVAFSKYIEGKEWGNNGYESIIEKLVVNLGSEAFWTLAQTIKSTLSEYNYHTSTRNMQLLVRLLHQNTLSTSKILFNKELTTQELWVSGNEHVCVKYEEEEVHNKFSVPTSFSEMSLYILLEQIESQNARKIESAIHGIYLLGHRFIATMDVVPSFWKELSLIQRECLLIVIARWVNDGNYSEKLVDMLLVEYDICNELSYKYILHSILLVVNNTCVEHDKLICNGHAIPLTLPKEGGTSDCNDHENFLQLIEIQSQNLKMTSDIRRFILQTDCEAQYVEDIYSEIGDSKIPVYSKILDEVLYGCEQSGSWNTISLLEKKSSLIPPEDPYVLTEMPYITFDEAWFPHVMEAYQEKKEDYLTQEILSQIAHYKVPEGYIQLASRLWHPWSHKEGTIYSESSKIDWYSSFYKNSKFEQILGNFGLLVREGSLVETRNAKIGDGGESLFNQVAGNSRLYFGNCQLAPSSVWRTVFECQPSKETPYVWEDKHGNDVLCFERIASPYREGRRENYIRQPILFRWICKQEWLNAALDEKNLQMWFFECIEEYPL